MARELAQREDGGRIITLIWDTNERTGENITWVDVVAYDNDWRVRVDPKMAFHAFTHAGAYVPEAWERAT